MANKYFRGDAPAVAQVTHVTPANPEIGDVLTLKINGKPISITVATATVAAVVADFVTAIEANAQEIPEWDEVTATAGVNDANEVTHIVLTGPSDGTPFTVTSATTNLSVLRVTVTTLQAGSAAQNQKQRLILGVGGAPTGGTFTLNFGTSDVTGNIAFNANAATLTTELEGLNAIGAGNVSVVENGTGDWTIEFTGDLAATSQPAIVGSGANLTGGQQIIITVVQESRAANYALGPLYSLTAPVADVHSFRFKFTGDTATFSGLAYYSDFVINGRDGATADDIRIALQSIMAPATLVSDSETADPPEANFQVYTLLDVMGPQGGPWTILVRNAGTVAAYDGVALAIDDTVYSAPGVQAEDNSSVELEILSEAETDAILGIQHIMRPAGISGGTFDLTYEGQTAAANVYNITAGNLETALEGLSTIGTVTVTGTGAQNDPWVVTFDDARMTKLTADPSSLTGAATSCHIIQDAAVGVNELQEVALTGGIPTGGTFTLTLNAETTGGIDWDATAAEVQTALVGLTTPVAGDILCTGGPLPDNPVLVEFAGAYANSNVAVMTGSGASLTASNTQTLTVESNTMEPTGPNWLDDPLNWSDGTLPVAGDKCYFQNLATSVLYDGAAITDTMAEVHYMRSFTGEWGLKPFDTEAGYFQYRGLYPQLRSTLTVVGEGNGSGSPFLNLNNGSVQNELIIHNTGEPEDTAIPAVHWKGTHASNVVRIFKGSFGAATFVGETATIATLQIGYVTDQPSDVRYAIGAGVTLPAVEISGGIGAIDLQADDIDSFRMTGGSLVIDGTAGVSETFEMSGESTVVWNTTGEMGATAQLFDQATLDLSQNMRAKNFPNPIDVYGTTAKVNDPWMVAASLIVSADPFYMFYGMAINYHTLVDCNGSKFGSGPVVARIPAE